MGKLRGSQEPRICVEPERVDSDGPDATRLFGAYGDTLDPWQSLVLDAWLGMDGSGNYSMTSGGLAVPRQNGKNVVLEAREFYGLLINGEKIIHTAHQVRTSKKSFRRLVRLFTDKKHPEIEAEVVRIRYTNGEEAIELHNGGVIEFSARSRQAARGFDGISLVVFDEAQELTDDQIEAIMPTLAASSTGTRQLIYAGTPPYPTCPGTVFRRLRESCIKSPGKRDAWHEWSVAAENLEDITVSDSTVWYMTNPAMGIHLTEEFAENELKTLTADGFARERLGWWAPTLSTIEDKCLNADAWMACASDATKPDGKTAFGVRFSADGAEVFLAGAVIPENGPARITLIDRKPTGLGTKWLAEWLSQRYGTASCVVIDGRNGVDVLIERLSETWKAKGSVIRTSPRDVLAAVSTLTTAVDENTLTWFRQQTVLSDSALSSVKRPLSGGWAFGGDDPGPIEACSLALWGAKICKRDPHRKMRIG